MVCRRKGEKEKGRRVDRAAGGHAYCVTRSNDQLQRLVIIVPLLVLFRQNPSGVKKPTYSLYNDIVGSSLELDPKFEHPQKGLWEIIDSESPSKADCVTPDRHRRMLQPSLTNARE